MLNTIEATSAFRSCFMAQAVSALLLSAKGSGLLLVYDCAPGTAGLVIR